MDFGFTPEEEGWREEVRQFIEDNPRDKFSVEFVDEGYGYGGWSHEFGKLLASKGWLTLTWPEEYGGRNLPWIYPLILFDELSSARAPWLSVNMAWTMANSILENGNDALKREFLPRIAAGDAVFWLAMSEPDAGSDLLGLKTTAMEEDDCYVINGQKVWSTFAHLADYGLLYARTETDPEIPRHKGVSVFILDKRLPGVEVRPLINVMGLRYHNEVFMDNVRLPKHYLLGQKNKGFYQMLESLEFDRFWARFIKPSFCRSVIEDLVQYAKETERDGMSLAEHPDIRHALAESAIEIEICGDIFWNAAWKIINSLPMPFESAVGKVLADEMGQRLFKKGMRIMGPYSQLKGDSRWAPLRAQMQTWYFSSIGHTIAGGTSEINRNTIATVGLGLPRK